MRRIDALSPAQRVVVVIALGLALWAVGNYVVSLGSGLGPGWYAYAPLTAGAYAPGRGLHAWVRVIIWLVLIGAWALASVRVLRPTSENAASE
jgi:heme/copper-type cytochrome/quinol oxidase subunit 1